jgi:hypothetical protein
MQVLETIKRPDGCTIEIYPDFDPESPRDFDNLGTFQVYHRRYNSPDPIVRPEPFIAKDEIGLKVYGYDHSGIAYSTTAFSCPWDSGLAGIIFVSREKAREWFGVKRLNTQKVIDALKAEVAIYSEYASGEVYGYKVIDPEGKEIDSCWGFYGSEREYMLEQAGA